MAMQCKIWRVKIKGIDTGWQTMVREGTFNLFLGM